MPDSRYGPLVDAATAVRTFAWEHLELEIVRTDVEKVINVDVAFAAFLRRRGVSTLLADDLAAEQRPLVRRKVVEQIGRWRNQGIDAPIGFSEDRDDVLLTWRHDRFQELTGHSPPRAELFAVAAWLATQTNRAFLLPCACFLKTLGCDPILVTDGTRDEGIDCLGLVRGGPLRSMALFVQAKSQKHFSGDELLQEYGKFAGLPQTPKYLRYLEALGTDKSHDGAAFVYTVLANSDFRHAAQQNARNVGALIRSRRQLAQQLSLHYTLERLVELQTTIRIPSTADLDLNLSPLLGF